MNTSIANLGTNLNNTAGDVIINNQFAYRVSSRIEKGTHTMILRDLNKVEVARATRQLGDGKENRTALIEWVLATVKELV